MFRSEFDATAELLCEKLCEIDRWVADAVVDQITEVFVEPSAAVNHLVHAAAARSPTTSPGVSGNITGILNLLFLSPLSFLHTHTRHTQSSPEISPSSSPTHTSEQEESEAQLTRQVELFRRHSKRLSQVASHAAQSSADSKREQSVLCLGVLSIMLMVNGKVV